MWVVICASYTVPFVSEVHITVVWVSCTPNKKYKEQNSTLTARLSWPCKPGGVPFDCRGKQTGGETVCLNNLGVPSQQCLASIESFTTRIHTNVLQIGPSLTTRSDDSGWARRRRVRVRGGRKVPEEPLAFTLPSLVQVVLLVAFFACSLVVVILFKIPHRRPAMFLKVFLVLCVRIICFRKMLCRVFMSQFSIVNFPTIVFAFWTWSQQQIVAHISLKKQI